MCELGDSRVVPRVPAELDRWGRVRHASWLRAQHAEYDQYHKTNSAGSRTRRRVCLGVYSAAQEAVSLRPYLRRRSAEPNRSGDKPRHNSRRRDVESVRRSWQTALVPRRIPYPLRTPPPSPRHGPKPAEGLEGDIRPFRNLRPRSVFMAWLAHYRYRAMGCDGRGEEGEGNVFYRIIHWVRPLPNQREPLPVARATRN